MKNSSTLFLICLFFFSCGSEKKQSLEQVLETNNLKTIRAKRTEIVAQQQEIANKLILLDQKIAQLDTTKKVPLITTFKVTQTNFKHYIELQGNVDTKQNIIIYPEFSGVLKQVFVTEGQQVSKGQTLAKIDDGGLSQQLTQLQIQANLAKTTFERQERLWNQKIGSEIQYLQAKTNYQSQQEAVNQLQKQISKTLVKAPFSGTIDDVITQQGSVVSPGMSPLFRIVNLNNMYIETEVPETYINNITKGKEVQVEFPILGKSIQAAVQEAESYINPANRTFKIKIPIANKNKFIKPNLTAKLKINDYTNPNAILIPQSIISENASGEQYIFVVENKNENGEGKAKKVIVKTGKPQGDVIEILEGLQASAEIIQEGARSVQNQQTVKVISYKK